ncbi:hypothetical protein BDV97DRAFT_225782 [Delphinella strobiligena]|nr:hypothetical protein BDV97DRAFT_225782 [Delphinella strobiligena]
MCDLDRFIAQNLHTPISYAYILLDWVERLNFVLMEFKSKRLKSSGYTSSRASLRGSCRSSMSFVGNEQEDQQSLRLEQSFCTQHTIFCFHVQSSHEQSCRKESKQRCYFANKIPYRLVSGERAICTSVQSLIFTLSLIIYRIHINLRQEENTIYCVAHISATAAQQTICHRLCFPSWTNCSFAR